MVKIKDKMVEIAIEIHLNIESIKYIPSETRQSESNIH